MVNKVILGGRVGNDIEVSYTKNGKPYIQLSIATDRAYRDKKSQSLFKEGRLPRGKRTFRSFASLRMTEQGAQDDKKGLEGRLPQDQKQRAEVGAKEVAIPF